MPHHNAPISYKHNITMCCSPNASNYPSILFGHTCALNTPPSRPIYLSQINYCYCHAYKTRPLLPSNTCLRGTTCRELCPATFSGFIYWDICPLAPFLESLQTECFYLHLWLSELTTESQGDLCTFRNVTKLTSQWVQEPCCSFLCSALGTGCDYVLSGLFNHK